MNRALVFITDNQIGDNVCAMGAVQFLAQRYDQLYLHTECKEIEMLMRPINVLPVSGMTPSGTMDCFNFFLGHGINKFGRDIHPISAYLGLANVHVANPPKPEITREIATLYDRDTKAPTFDVLIHPWAKGSERAMSHATFIRTLLELRKVATVGVLGAVHDPTFPTPGVQYIYGHPLSYVVALMRKARCVITTDSGMSRLADAALEDVSKHIVLEPFGHYPAQWTTFDGCRAVMATAMTETTSDWEVDMIMGEVDQVLCVTR